MPPSQLRNPLQDLSRSPDNSLFQVNRHRGVVGDRQAAFSPDRCGLEPLFRTLIAQEVVDPPPSVQLPGTAAVGPPGVGTLDFPVLAANKITQS